MYDFETHPELNPDTPSRQFVSRAESPERNELADDLYERLTYFHRGAAESPFAVLLGEPGSERSVLAVAAIQPDRQGPTGYEATYYSHNRLENRLTPTFRAAFVPTLEGTLADRGTTQLDLQEIQRLLSADGLSSPRLLDLGRFSELTGKPPAPGRFKRLLEKLR